MAAPHDLALELHALKHQCQHYHLAISTHGTARPETLEVEQTNTSCCNPAKFRPRALPPRNICYLTFLYFACFRCTGTEHPWGQDSQKQTLQPFPVQSSNGSYSASFLSI